MIKTYVFLLAIVGVSVCFTGAQNDTLALFSTIHGLDFNSSELDSLRPDIDQARRKYELIREVPIDNAVPPSLFFDPLPTGFEPFQIQDSINWPLIEQVVRPDNDQELAFLTVIELASLIRSRQITAEELTRFFIQRLRIFADTLECVISLTENRAVEQARRLDEELAQGIYRGPLHGIPYGAKDLFAVPEYPTTWGASPYRGQHRSETATVIQKLDRSGAILIAKLTMGALAWGDVWFGGKTKNPWNLEQGSSGSSAGSASAVAAGLVPFALGTETLGSIISPSTRCGTTGLRPTFGRISRYGAMALSWSMDKIGPICRTATDCALVFDAIRGPDQLDKTVIDAAFNYNPKQSVSTLKVAYFRDLFSDNYKGKINDSLSLLTLEQMGVELSPISFDINLPISAIDFILDAEAAASFDLLTRSDRDDELVRQVRKAWPNVFRAARFIPAVEFIQANRIRTLLIEQLHEIFKNYHAIITPTFGGKQLTATNLAGHPAIVLPNGFGPDGTPTSITILGNLFGESHIIRLAEAFQSATNFEDRHPQFFR